MLHARPSFALASSPPSQDFAQHRSTIATANGTLAVAKASTDFAHHLLAASDRALATALAWEHEPQHFHSKVRVGDWE